MKLANCATCFTVSEYNRNFILENYPAAEPQRVLVSRLGVEIPEAVVSAHPTSSEPFHILAVGRLHAVKDHAFLIRACAELLTNGLQFKCEIAGEGPERRRLEGLISKFALQNHVALLGHTPPEELESAYRRADVVVLTSRSEGIPLVLMEAMVRGKLVLAPSITGIPELVKAGTNGLLYKPGSMADFLAQLHEIHSIVKEPRPPAQQTDSRAAIACTRSCLDWMRHAARAQVCQNFNRKKNVEAFAGQLLRVLAPQIKERPRADSLLQQV